MKEIGFKGIDLETGEEIYGYYVALPDPYNIGELDYILTTNTNHEMMFRRIKTGSAKQFIGETDANSYSVYDGDKLIDNKGDIYTIGWSQRENGWRFYSPNGTLAIVMGYPHEELREMELVKEKDEMSIDGRPG